MDSIGTAMAAVELIERDAELGAIEQALAAAADGRGTSTVVEGAAGIGKSALLDRTAELAGDAGLQVLAARADILERDFPYGVVRQLLETTLRKASTAERERLLEGASARAGDVLLGSATPGRESAALVAHGVYWLASALAEDQPLLLLVDDAHWADRASARTLLHLARRLGDVPIGLVVALRPGEPGAPPEIKELLAADPRTTALVPKPLSEAGSADLVRRWRDDADNELCLRCHSAAEGNPLVVGELARIVSDAGPDVLADDGSLRGSAHSPVLDREVRRRLAGLERAPRASVEALAILGDGTTPARLAALAGLELADVSSARDPLVASGLLAEGDQLAFSHAVIRQAVEASLSRGERAAGHRQAAALLRRDAAPIDAVAAHLLLSDPAGDASTVATLREAARAATDRGAPETATTYLQRALEEPPAAEEHAAVLVELSTTEFDSGAPGAADHLRAALPELEDHAARIDVLTRLAALEVLQEGGKADSKLFEEEIEAVGAESELGLAIELAALDVLLMIPGRQRERQARVAELPAPPPDPGPHHRIAMAHRAWMAAELGEVPHHEVRRMALEALEGDALLKASTHRVAFHLATRALLVSDALPEAEAVLRRMEDDVIRRGSLRMRAAVDWYVADLHLRAGRIGDAENEARLVLAFHEDRDAANCGAVEALVNALVERGELEEAQAVLREHGWDGPLTEQYREVGLRLARARLALALGEAERALEEALDCGRLRELQGRPNPAWTPWRSTAAMACLLSGDGDRALSLADEELGLARAFGAPRATAIALRARALASADHDEALALHREAVALLERGPAELEHARALADVGAALRKAGDLTAARDPLRVALSDADRLGASALAARAREELVATGLRPRRAPLTGVGALTPRQRRVCELAAEGHTNRAIAQELFVTVKTVETHLQAAYLKLGIGSKTELAGPLSEAGPASPSRA